jgi:putative ABC transport system substrate-binding protein
MNKYLLYFIVILSSISCSVHAANTIQILTAKAGDTAELSQYLQKNINDDVIISINHQIDLKADLIIVLNESVIEKLPSERPPTLFVLPQPLAIELQKKDSALYWTPSLAMQLALIKAILPATNRVGMLVSANNEDQSWLRTFKQYAVEKGIEVFIQTLDKSRIGRQVSDLAVSTDVLLAQPDSSIYNRETIRFILLAAYRQNKALIGPSLAFVNAGSLATLYAPSSTINQEILQRVQYFLKQKKLPYAGRIKNMEFSINPQVAKSLGLKIPSTEELQTKMRFEELPIWP